MVQQVVFEDASVVIDDKETKAFGRLETRLGRSTSRLLEIAI
jgi:hypothetical protein